MLVRALPRDLVEQTLADPEQIVPSQGGMVAYQSRFESGGGKIYLMRVIVSTESEPPVVVTVYRTSRLSKYWRSE